LQSMIFQRVDSRFRDFALFSRGVGGLSYEWYRKWVTEHCDAARELRDLIEVIRFSADTLYNVPVSLAFEIDEEGVMTNLTRGSLLPYLIEERISIRRLKICPVCDDIFWQVQRGEVRHSLTCGKRHCSETLGNRKRKKKGDENYGGL